ncbi:MAG: hypothetical protein M9891_00430 [Austwickia sp.]|nr:hypothetical protein [Tetrasphaera sp.]MCO5307756.1 hypothetical protein [Austwickia sp.]
MSDESNTIPPDESFVARQAKDVRRILGTPEATAGRATAGSGGPAGVRPGEEIDDRGGADQTGPEVVVPPFRILVATNFDSGSFSATTVPIAVLRAFATMFETGSPVNLVFAVDHEADDADLLGAQALLGEVQTDRSLAGVSIESFDEAPAQPTYVSLIPHGDPAALITDLAKTLTAMHLLAETLAHPGRLRIALVHQHLIARVRDRRLADRLTSYREVDLPGL